MIDTVLAAIEHPGWDPVFLRLGPLALRWYGVAYILAFLVAMWVLGRMIRAGRLRITHDQLASLIGWLVIGVMAGGRLGWWLIYDRPAGPQPWYEPLAAWRGGMSFHGGLVGVLVVLLLWSWRNRVGFLHLADALSLITPIGLLLGRLANFVNAELVGRPTDVPWGVIFPGDVVARHPSQLYEAMLEGPVLLLVTYMAWRFWRGRDGMTTSTFLMFYGLFRFAVEFTREPDVQLGFIAFGWLTMGQLLSVLTALVGLALTIYSYRRPTPPR